MEKTTLVIHDNPLSNELRAECQLINKVKILPLESRREHYGELCALVNKILDNKNRNFRETTARLLDDPFSDGTEIACVLDKETEDYIKEIFNIITNKLD